MVSSTISGEKQKAVIVSRIGHPVEISSRPINPPDTGQVLIKVTAATSRTQFRVLNNTKMLILQQSFLTTRTLETSVCSSRTTYRSCLHPTSPES